jgi:hypothetical protein
MGERKESIMSDEHPRIARERKTVEAMIRMYCADLHNTPQGLCPACDELLAYARERLNKCPYQAGKTTCAKCPIHCYKLAMREQIRAVMRYANPRMIRRHPVMALAHLVDGMRKEPIKPENGDPADAHFQ